MAARRIHLHSGRDRVRPAVLARQAERFALPSKVFARDELFTDVELPPRRSGVYGWYFDAPPPGVPTAGCVQSGRWWLLYVGIAPKAPPTNGKPPSRATLRSRLRQHFGGTAGGSTLRFTLGCLLSNELGLNLAAAGTSGRGIFTAEREAELSRWMARHARVCWVEHPAPWLLEHELLGRLTLPLNLHGNEGSAFRAELSACRAAARAQARARLTGRR